jgi:hypothetical protein
VSFLVAIFALIPLRFIEAGEQESLFNNAQVLGEKISEPVFIEEVTSGATIKLEAPYDRLDACISEQKAKEAEDEVINQLENKELGSEEIVTIVEKLREIEVNICR